MIQWLRLPASTGPGLITSQGTKIPYAEWHGQKERKRIYRIKRMYSIFLCLLSPLMEGLKRNIEILVSSRKNFSENLRKDFPGGPVVRTLCFHCWGCGFNPCGELGSYMTRGAAKTKPKNQQQKTKCKEISHFSHTRLWFISKISPHLVQSHHHSPGPKKSLLSWPEAPPLPRPPHLCRPCVAHSICDRQD